MAHLVRQSLELNSKDDNPNCWILTNLYYFFIWNYYD